MKILTFFNLQSGAATTPPWVLFSSLEASPRYACISLTLTWCWITLTWCWKLTLAENLRSELDQRDDGVLDVITMPGALRLEARLGGSVLRPGARIVRG
jgi:hypothetical protein